MQPYILELPAYDDFFFKNSAKAIQIAIPITKGIANRNAVDAGALYPAYLIPHNMEQ